MQKIEENGEYFSLISHILNNDEFKKIKNIEHHGVTRYDHSLRVSYYSYRISKFLKLDYEKVATGGLLHDFFLSSEERNKKERFLSTFNHPKKAVLKASEEFEITEKEKDIIRTHMFPINLSVPISLWQIAAYHQKLYRTKALLQPLPISTLKIQKKS